MTRTFTPKAGEIQREWLVIDATDVVLGRLASHAAALLRGKHKATFAPHVDSGDHVIIINADKVALTGQKLEKKMAYRNKFAIGLGTLALYAAHIAAATEAGFSRWHRRLMRVLFCVLNPFAYNRNKVP